MEDLAGSGNKLFDYSGSTRTVSLSMNQVIKILAGLTIVSFYLNLVLGCGYVFTCRSFTPSPNYLGCFLGYNRFYVVSLTLLSITMGLTYLGIYLEFASKSSLFEKIVLKGVGIYTCTSLPVIALTNEVNSTHAISFPMVYYFLSYSALLLNFLWLVVMYHKAGKGIYCKTATKVCCNAFVILILCYVFVEVQRIMNYKTENWVINTTAWSISEWVLTTIGIIFVALVADINKSFKITFGGISDPVKEDQQIELEEINN